MTVPNPGRGGGADPNVLLLSCMDMRLLEKTLSFMAGRGLSGRYDHVVLAGAALGVVYDEHSHWSRTFWDHLDLARELHDVREVHILEHRDCGAYKKLLGLHFQDDPHAEARKHAESASRLRTLIHQRHADLEVRSFLIALDGNVIEI
jgi:carbonic anhydrase